jgi:hypothetical protein
MKVIFTILFLLGAVNLCQGRLRPEAII